MADRTPIFRSTTGLNTVTDPAELVLNLETAAVELSQAVNLDISNTGRRISRRKGYSLLQTGEYHSGFWHGNDVLCVREYATSASLFRLTPETGAMVGLRSGLTKNRRMFYWAVNDLIYYTNGEQNGIYENMQSRAWTREDYVGWESDLDLVDAPVGDCIASYGGFMLISQGPVVWQSEEFDFSAYNLANRYHDLVEDVTMIRPVVDGTWIGTTTDTYFMTGRTPALWEVAFKTNHAVLKGAASARTIKGTDFGPDGLVGDGYFWLSSQGIVWGGPSTQHFVLTDKRIDPADLVGRTGTCEYFNNRVVAIIDP